MQLLLIRQVISFRMSEKLTHWGSETAAATRPAHTTESHATTTSASEIEIHVPI